jgi:1-acyl-sn-glycerol-3-phosphate acyltransferase
MFIMGKLMHKILCQPIHRENDREALKSILKCIQLLKTDEVSIGAFPEGGIFDKDKLHPFRSGVFKIAQKAQVPIVVCTIQGSEHVIKNLKKLKPLPRVQLHLLEVIPAEDLVGKTTVEIAQRVRSIMLADLAEKYQPVNE